MNIILPRSVYKLLRVFGFLVIFAAPLVALYHFYLQPIDCTEDYLFLTGTALAELVIALLLIKVEKIPPTKAMIVQGFRNVNDVRGPGWTFYWYVWETPYLVSTEVMSVNVDSQNATTWITPENSDDPAPITVRAEEISADFQFSITGNRATDIQNAKDFLRTRGSLFSAKFKTEDGEEVLESAQAKEVLSDAVQGAFRRYCADPGVPWNQLLYDTGAARRYILTELRSFQRGCDKERDETRQRIKEEIVSELKAKAKDEVDNAKEQRRINQALQKMYAGLRNTQRINDQVDQVMLPANHPDASYWGVKIIKVTVEEIEPGDEKVKQALEAAATMLYEERAEIARVKKETRVAQLEIKRDINRALARGEHFKTLADLVSKAFGIPKGDPKVKQFILDQLTLQTAEKVAEKIGQGNSLVMAGLDIPGQLKNALTQKPS